MYPNVMDSAGVARLQGLLRPEWPSHDHALDTQLINYAPTPDPLLWS